MKRVVLATCLLFGAFTSCAPLRGQESPGDRVSVPFSDPGRPGKVSVQVIAGGIIVRGYDGKDVTVEARPRAERERRTERSRDGLRRITNTATGLSVEEENNEMRVSTRSQNRPQDLVLQVPKGTSLKLSTINDGDILVENVDGDIEVNNTNGGVTLTGVVGAVVAHALNDDLKVTFARAPSGKPMSFSSLNGDIDVTLPGTTKATLRLETNNGEILTDFDVQLQATPMTQTVEPRSGKGRYRVRIEKAMMGTINGGGSELTFKTFNGDIRIRKQP